MMYDSDDLLEMIQSLDLPSLETIDKRGAIRAICTALNEAYGRIDELEAQIIKAMPDIEKLMGDYANLMWALEQLTNVIAQSGSAPLPPDIVEQAQRVLANAKPPLQ